MFSAAFHAFAIVALLAGAASTSIVAVDVIRHPQRMAIMNVVWPVVAFFGTVLVVIGYFRYGRAATGGEKAQAKADGRSTPADAQPFAVAVAKGSLHCGAGCMLGDLAAEWLVFAFPVVAVWAGWHSLFDDRMFAVWIVDFVFAFALGIVFQNFAIAPMRGLSPGVGLVAALKADALSLTAWQIGMYGFMAFAQRVWLPHAYGRRAPVDSPEFWFVMQLAMIAGFCTAYPVNGWLIRAGIKERM